MASMTQTTDWRWGFRNSRMVCLVWSPAPQHQALQRKKLAYAQALGKPIRLLRVGATRIPEDVCAGYADVQVARVASQAEMAAQIETWLAALDEEC